MTLRLKLGLGACLAIATMLPTTSSAQVAAITLEQAHAELEGARALLVGIREPEERATGIVAGTQLLRMRQLARRLAELPRDRPVLLICNTENGSRATRDALRERGYINLRYVSGGMGERGHRGWPLVPRRWSRLTHDRCRALEGPVSHRIAAPLRVDPYSTLDIALCASEMRLPEKPDHADLSTTL